jgi:GT2 family glycosyltransferase
MTGLAISTAGAGTPMTLLRTPNATLDVPGPVVFELRLTGSKHGGQEHQVPGGGIRGVSVVICTYRRPGSLADLLASLDRQTLAPLDVIIVDASPDHEAEVTQQALRSWKSAPSLHYVQVTGAGRGLTRQRNLGLRLASGDLVLFLDDDVVLEPECVDEMERAHRAHGSAVAGVGCHSTSHFAPAPLLWRLRRALRIVPSLQPGRYWRSGVSVPWTFERPRGTAVEGDWLPGCAMMWRADVLGAVRFDEEMEGYSQGEDLDFSLRARQMGRLMMLSTPRLDHRHQAAGRPDAYRLGQMEIRNRFAIHRRAIANRTWRDVVWFTYAWALDTVLLGRHVVFGSRRTDALRQIAGRVTAGCGLCARWLAPRAFRNGR